jgi:hypothetical protein
MPNASRLFYNVPFMACPYFLPAERLASPLWPHPARLPLGAAWSGRCTSPTAADGGNDAPGEHDLKHGCNLGYARNCPRLPQQRTADAVRMAVIHDRDGRITLQYVFEMAYLPAGHGLLEYDAGARAWLRPHPDARVQRMAECYLESYWLRRKSET